ncbi:transthyretin-like family domain-containing protein [Ditylenchus destructor]|nr:transthyretin-like family domain-containing protein [Ditylenchus destructor]
MNIDLWIILRIFISSTFICRSSGFFFKTGGVTSLETPEKRLQGIGVRGRLLCGRTPLNATKVKIVDVDIRPDPDDLLGETLTDVNGLFQLAGATREDTTIEVLIKIYHDCLDLHKPCQRKVIWKVPPVYYNNGTLTEWFDVGTVNMEIVFPHEERDCRH